MIRIGLNNVYEMNESTTLTEDFKNALKLNKEFEKNSPEKNQKFMRELGRLGTEVFVTESLNSNHEALGSRTKTDTEKKSFYDYVLYFRSEDPPNIYKLSGDLSTFDDQDIKFNNTLSQRIINDYQRKKYIDELTNKDIQKKNFGEKCLDQKKEPKTVFSKDELAGRIELEILKPPPKPPKKWQKFVDDEGDEYYYNLVTKVSQWSRPEKYED